MIFDSFVLLNTLVFLYGPLVSYVFFPQCNMIFSYFFFFFLFINICFCFVNLKAYLLPKLFSIGHLLQVFSSQNGVHLEYICMGPAPVHFYENTYYYVFVELFGFNQTV